LRYFAGQHRVYSYRHLTSNPLCTNHKRCRNLGIERLCPRRTTLQRPLPSYQLEDGVISDQWAKSFAGRAGGYREIPLHGELIPVEVGLQNFWLFVVRKQTRTELLGSPSFFQ